jgi:hypothetical protein
MGETFFAARGEMIEFETLSVPKARQLTEFLRNGAHPWARLLETRCTAGPDLAETIVLEVDVEVGQQPMHDVRSVERIAVTFLQSDRHWPEVLALRSDFPRDVPHLFPRKDDEPCSLCLYEDSYEELKLRWTALKVVERVRFWLRETSRSSLHGSDQPLEPVFIGGNESLVLPTDLFSGNGNLPERLWVHQYDHGLGRNVYVATREERPQTARGLELIATVFVAQPRGHGAIRFAPTNLLELDIVSRSAGLELLSELRSRLLEWRRDARLLASRLVLVIAYPKIRHVGSPVEASDVWAFGTREPIVEVGKALSLWEPTGPGVVGGLVGVPFEVEKGRDVTLIPLNPHFALSRVLAAIANGVAPDNRRFVAVGVGALGSQTVGTLIRSGYGLWRFIDQDVFLPHNAARHELPHGMVGWTKARAMTQWVNTLTAEPSAEEGIVANLLELAGQGEVIEGALGAAEVVADFSASQAVARRLARDFDGSARRVSAFLNPSGTDVVVLSEDRLRTIPIDAVEMQYYRMLLEVPELENHFRPPDGSIRMARSCRDVSTILAGDVVSHHAAIASRGLRRALEQDEASIQLWTSDRDFNTRLFRAKPAQIIERRHGSWKLATDEVFVKSVCSLRQAKLPRETGGVLLGTWDLVRGIVYVVATIPSPDDSEEWPTSYIRGCRGLEAAVRSAEARTGSQLQYLGEWHSHPAGHSADPSEDDGRLFGWLEKYMSQAGFPPVMLIVGEAELRWIIGSL